MKLMVLLAAACLAMAQDDWKNLSITTENGAVVSMRAEEILREPNLIHLKGKVEIRTWWVGQPYSRNVTLRADAALYHVETGEIEPLGSVTVRPVRER